MRARHGLIIATMALATAVAGSATAAPDHSAPLSAATPKFEWTGTGSGAPFGLVGIVFDFAEEPNPLVCSSPASDCDDILLELKEPGDLSLTAAVEDPNSVPDPDEPEATVPDVDMYVYPSNAAGEVTGEQISENADSASAKPVEVANLPDLAAGFYLVHIEFFAALEATYKGTADFVSDAPAPAATPTPSATAEPTATAAPQSTPTPQPQSQPQQPAQQQPATQPQPAAKAPAKKTSKRAACTKKAKKIKNKRKRAKALKRCKKLKG